MRKTGNPDPSNLARLVAAGRQKMASVGLDPAPGGHRRWILVDVAGQRIVLVQDDLVEMVRPVSTASAGIDCRLDSKGTPCGLHIVAQKIGEGAPRGTVFSSREPTGDRWRPGTEETEPDDLILSRILTLDGQEEGVNRGPGVDSLARYIYIHGTNQEDRIGTPVSHGCIRMTNDHVMELFELVDTGDPVVII